MRRTKKDADKTRCSILQAAEVLFMEKGVSHTSLDAIASQAGVTRGAVYWHFKNKADLFHEMLNQVCLPPEDMAALLENDSVCDSMIALRNHCIQVVEGLARDERKRRIFTILLYRCEFTEELSEAEKRHNSFVKQTVELTERLFAQAHSRGLLQPGLTPPIAARTLHALLLGLFIDGLRTPELFDLLQDARVMIDSVFRGMLREQNIEGCSANAVAATSSSMHH